MDDLKYYMKEYYNYWSESNRIYEKWAKKHGLTMYSLYALMLIEDKKGCCTQKDICKDFALPKQTVNSILKKFEQEEIITFEQSSEDSRFKHIVFTKKGIEFAGSITKKVYEMEKQAMLKLSKENRRIMTESNKFFMNTLKEIFENDR